MSNAITDLTQQLKKHGIDTLADIEQGKPTEIAAHYHNLVSGGKADEGQGVAFSRAEPGEFLLLNQDGSGTFGKAG